MTLRKTRPPKKPAPSAPPEYRDPLPITQPRAAGIDVGDASHWVCVGDAPDATREFPAHTPGLRDLVDWLRQRGVSTVALEASGAYGHVLFLTLVEAGFATVMTSPAFTRQIKGRPKTDRLDCQWIRRLHAHGLLPSVFQPDEATQTLRSFVRQRGNLVRLSGQHIQRMQKALELMNLKLTKVLGDITGVTGLKILRAILAGERDPEVLAKLRDHRCKRAEPEIAQALDGRYRIEHLSELRSCLAMWDAYQVVIAELDGAIHSHLVTMRRQSALPALPTKTRVRGRKPHFRVRNAEFGVRNSRDRFFDSALRIPHSALERSGRRGSTSPVGSASARSSRRRAGRCNRAGRDWARTARPSRCGWRRGA